MPSRLLFFDSETMPETAPAGRRAEVHRLRLGAATTFRRRKNKKVGRKQHRFAHPEEFLSILDGCLESKRTLWVIAHNASFDAQICGLLDAIKTGRYTFVERAGAIQQEDEDSIWSQKTSRFFLMSDPPTILHLQDADGRRFVLLDSMNWVCMPLKKLGDMIGLPKMTMPPWDASDDEWFEYCERDVEILERWFDDYSEFIRVNELGSMKWTFSSQAMTAYRSRYMPEGIESHCLEDVRELERSSYFGGEFRCFALGEFNEPVHQYDVNSLFPSVMLDRLYPASLARWSYDDRWQKVPLCFKPEECCAEVFISTWEEEYLKRIDDQPVPCIGEFSTFLCGPELAAAVERGHVVGFRQWAAYEMADLFSEFVRGLYELRQSCKAAGREDLQFAAKLLMNSLYGKFGQRGTELVYSPGVIPNQLWGRHIEVRPSTGENWEYLVINGDCYRKTRRKELRSSTPIISAWIASAAREAMRQHRSLLDDGSVLYQAIDSLIVTEAGKAVLEGAGLVDESELGKFKLAASSDALKIHGHGWYQIGNRMTLPGRKRTIAVDKDGGYEQTQFDGLKTLIIREPDPVVWSSRRFVKFPGDFTRGKVGPDGIVSPLVLSEPRPF